MSHEHAEAKQIFGLALDLPKDERAAYIEKKAAGDPAMLATIKEWLDAHERAGSFLDQPATLDLDDGEVNTLPGIGDSLGSYKIVLRIGEGGFSVVFLAEQEQPIPRQVALKVIRPGMDSKAIKARFDLERQALARMNHANIACIFDAGTTPHGLPYFVMEHVPGEPITTFCDRHSLSVRDRLELFISVCNAVQHAHQRGIIHRDLKPSNVLVSNVENHPVPKVIDFGVSKATGPDLADQSMHTQIGQIIGTLEYMSPEQAGMGDADIDTRTDVYSLGVLLYELLSGCLPLDLHAAAVVAALKRIQEEEPPRPSTRLSAVDDKTAATIATNRQDRLVSLTRELHRELDWIPMKALRKDPAQRYGSPADLAKDVQRYLNGEPLEAGPESAAYRMHKSLRKNWRLATAATFLLVSLAVGLVGTLWQKRRADDRADQLKQVSDFQSKMLAEIDITKAGIDLMADVRKQFAEALEKGGVPEVERAKQADALRAQLVRVNATDIAAAMIDRVILNSAAAAIDKQFKHQPVVDAQLRQSLADLYQNIGQYDMAMPLQEAALATRLRVLGEKHPDTLISINNMGYLLQAQDKLAEAEPYYREALEKSRRVLGDDHPDTIMTISNMGYLLQAWKKFEEAELYFREALERSRRALGEENLDTLTAINNMGVLLQAQKKFAAAEPYVREALEKRRRILGEEHPNTIGSINNLGSLLQELGKLAEAEPYVREALENSRRVQGEEHPDTIVFVNNLVSLLQKRRNPIEAERYAREAVEMSRRILGEEHQDTLNSINNMGSLLQDQGRLAEAEPYFREVLEKRRNMLGEEHQDTLWSFHNMGTLLRDQGKLAEAELYLRQALAKSRRVLGQEHPDTLIFITSMGSLLRRQGKLQDAISLLAPAESATRGAFTDGNARRLAAFLTALGNARVGLGYDAEQFHIAESNLTEAHTILIQTRGEMHIDTLNGVQGLVDLYTAWEEAEPDKGFGEQAATWRSKLPPSR